MLLSYSLLVKLIKSKAFGLESETLQKMTYAPPSHRGADAPGTPHAGASSHRVQMHQEPRVQMLHNTKLPFSQTRLSKRTQAQFFGV